MQDNIPYIILVHSKLISPTRFRNTCSIMLHALVLVLLVVLVPVGLVVVVVLYYGQNVCVDRGPAGTFTGKRKNGTREDFGHDRS